MRVETLDRARAKEIAAASRRRDGLSIEVAGWRSSSDPVLYLPLVHELLTDAADWDAATWDMDRDGVEQLATTLEWLFAELPGELTFEATWDGPAEEKPVARAGLLALVRASEIGTRTRYRVSAGAG